MGVLTKEAYYMGSISGSLVLGTPLKTEVERPLFSESLIPGRPLFQRIVKIAQACLGFRSHDQFGIVRLNRAWPHLAPKMPLHHNVVIIRVNQE